MFFKVYRIYIISYIQLKTISPHTPLESNALSRGECTLEKYSCDTCTDNKANFHSWLFASAAQTIPCNSWNQLNHITYILKGMHFRRFLTGIVYFFDVYINRTSSKKWVISRSGTYYWHVIYNSIDLLLDILKPKLMSFLSVNIFTLIVKHSNSNLFICLDLGPTLFVK